MEFEENLQILRQAQARSELPRYLEAPLPDLVNKLGIHL
jgi:hypothetical protein